MQENNTRLEIAATKFDSLGQWVDGGTFTKWVHLEDEPRRGDEFDVSLVGVAAAASRVTRKWTRRGALLFFVELEQTSLLDEIDFNWLHQSGWMLEERNVNR